jgi:prepilin-type N-terminal cleavage/methylation domain-containing protein
MDRFFARQVCNRAAPDVSHLLRHRSLSRPSPLPARAAFTLLEILVVLSLIGLLTGVLITGSSRLLTDRPVSVETVFWAAVAEVRKEAMVEQREVRLRFDANAKSLVSASLAGQRSFAMPPGEVQVDFLAPASQSNNVVLIGGLLVETEPLGHVTFFDDGTCTPFRVQIRTGGPARMLTVDPWTCAEVLVAAK